METQQHSLGSVPCKDSPERWESTEETPQETETGIYQLLSSEQDESRSESVPKESQNV